MPNVMPKRLEIASKDPNSDGLLVILAPQGMTDPFAVAERLQPYALASGKPLLASWMGGVSVASGEKVLNTAGIPTFSYPDTAARAFTYMWRYSYNLHGLYETPTLVESLAPEGASRSRAADVIDKARNRGRRAPHRTRIEANPVVLRNSYGRNPKPPRTKTTP